MKVDHDKSDLKPEAKPGSDQLSQGDPRVNEIADKTHYVIITHYKTKLFRLLAISMLNDLVIQQLN